VASELSVNPLLLNPLRRVGDSDKSPFVSAADIPSLGKRCRVLVAVTYFF